MNILIINLHSSLNLGDAAIMEETIRQLRMVFPQAHFTLATNTPDSHVQYAAQANIVGTFKSWIYRIGKDKQIHYSLAAIPFAFATAVVAGLTFRLFGYPLYLTTDHEKRRLMEAYFSADIVVNSGGQVLTAMRRAAFSYLTIIFSSLYAPLTGKPLYMFPQTIGPFISRLHRRLAEAVLRHTRIVLIRDRELFNDAIRSKALHRKAIYVPDAALGLAPGNPERGWEILRKSGVLPAPQMPTIGMTVMQWGEIRRSFERQSEYEHAMISLMRYIVQEMDGRVLLFGQGLGPSYMEDDHALARKLRDQAGLPSTRAIVIDRIKTPTELVDAYSILDILVGTRMHSNIMTLVSSVPVLAVAYTLKKHRGMLQDLGLARWVCDMETLTEDDLIEAFQQAWAARDETRAHLARTMPEIQKAALQASQAIAADWEKIRSSKRK